MIAQVDQDWLTGLLTENQRLRERVDQLLEANNQLVFDFRVARAAPLVSVPGTLDGWKDNARMRHNLDEMPIKDKPLTITPNGKTYGDILPSLMAHTLDTAAALAAKRQAFLDDDGA